MQRNVVGSSHNSPNSSSHNSDHHHNMRAIHHSTFTLPLLLLIVGFFWQGADSFASA